MNRSSIYPSSLVLLFGILLLGLGSGCGAGRAMIIKPSDTKIRVSSLSISEANSPIAVPTEIKSSFQKKAEELLYAEGAFQKGSELNIRYRFIQFDPGNQFTRWFWGGIGNAGEGSLTVEAKYFDAANNEISTIHSEGRIGSGAFGGSFDYAVEKAAEKIAEYTRTNFR